MYQVVSNTCL